MPYHIQKYHLPSTSQDIDEFQGTILSQIKKYELYDRYALDPGAYR